MSSGYPPGSSGYPPKLSGAGHWGAFKIGAGIGAAGATVFQLAPRLYVLSQMRDRKRTAARQVNGHANPLRDLPLHLIFRHLPVTGAEQTRQAWISEVGRDWTWELAIDSRAGTIVAVLTAKILGARSAITGSLAWKNAGNWEPFGTNVLEAEFGDGEIPPLTVTAP
jgi:hypothetical protein